MSIWAVLSIPYTTHHDSSPSLRFSFLLNLSLLHKLIYEELEGGEEEKPQGLEKINYDLVLEPADLQSALSALGDIKNYGIYANNLRDPKIITKIFSNIL